MVFIFKKSFWDQPVFQLNTRKDKWNLIIFVSVFVPLFLLIFQPFGVNNFDPTHSISRVFLFSMMGFGLVQGVVLVIYEFVIVPLVFKSRALSSFIIRTAIELVLLAASTFLYYNILGNFHDWYFKSFLDFIFNVGLMSIIPFAIIILYFNYRKSQKAYQLLELQPKLALNEKYINLRSLNGKEQLTITLADLLFIEAQDNYVSVHYLEKEIVKRQLLRATMKDVEANLNNDFIIRCHRSFIVNINNVEKVTRDSHQMKLFLASLSESIPVSRSYIPILETLLDVHHK
jgi:hypothetical protein